MPIFEYVCKNCKNTFEELVKRFDDKVVCPKCGGEAVKSFSGQMYSATGKTVKKCSGNCKTCGGCK